MESSDVVHEFELDIGKAGLFQVCGEGLDGVHLIMGMMVETLNTRFSTNKTQGSLLQPQLPQRRGQESEVVIPVRRDGEKISTRSEDCADSPKKFQRIGDMLQNIDGVDAIISSSTPRGVFLNRNRVRLHTDGVFVDRRVGVNPNKQTGKIPYLCWKPSSAATPCAHIKNGCPAHQRTLYPFSQQQIFTGFLDTCYVHGFNCTNFGKRLQVFAHKQH